MSEVHETEQETEFFLLHAIGLYDSERSYNSDVMA